MTVTIQTVNYVNFGDGATTGYYAVPLWTLNTAYTVGQIVRQKTTPAVGSERTFICTTAGTSSNTTEPTWVLTRGGKVASLDGTVQWFEATGLPALNGDLTSTPLSSQNRSGAQTTGNLITNNTQDHYFFCTTAGSTGAGEPTYNTTLGATTADSGATWTCIGPVSSFTTAWHAPHARMGNVAISWVAAGGTIYVSVIHAETSAASTTLTATGTASSSVYTSYICVSNTPSLPPVVADITTGAAVITTGVSSPLTVNGIGFFQGVSFSCGTLGSAQSFTVGNTASAWMRLLNCALTLGGTAGQQLLLGNETTKLILENTPVTFTGSNAATIQLTGGLIVWRDTTTALVKAGAAWPTTLFAGTLPGSAVVFLENLDLSPFAGTAFLGTSSGTSRIVLSDCKVPALAAFATTASLSGPHSSSLDLINCDSGGKTYQHSRWGWEGTQTVDTVALRVGGASDGTTSFSWNVVTSANSKWLIPFECMPINIWNPTAANVTVTIEGAYNGAALPNNDEIWLETVYFGTASSTLGTRNTETKATVLSSGTPLSASTASWTGAARQNTHPYVVGDEIGVSSTGSVVRLFICTGAGTSLGSTPVAYASATDGTSVTDGGAVFRAVMRFKMTAALTTPHPQSAGYFLCYVKAALASATYWVDPYVTLS